MSLDPLILSADDAGRAPASTVRSPQFRRMLGYVWPYRKHLFLSFVAAVIFAGLHTLSIASVLPVLKVILEKEGLHGWIDRTVAGQRLDLELRRHLGVGEIVVERISERHKLYAQGLRAGSRIVPAFDRPDAWLQRVAATAEDQSLTLRALPPLGDSHGVFREFHVAARPLDWTHRAMVWAGRLIDRDRAGRDPLHVLAIVLAFLCLAVLLSGVFRFLAEYWVSAAVLRGMVQLRGELYHRVLRLPMSFFVTHPTADLVSSFVQDVQEIQRGLLALFGKVAREPLKAAFILILAFNLDWQITLTMLAMAPVAVVVFWAIGRKVKKANRRLLQEYGAMIGQTTTTLQAIDVVKAYTTEPVEQQRLGAIDRNVFRHQLKLAALEALMGPLLEVLAVFAVSGLVVWLGGRVVRGNLEPAEFLTLAMVMGSLLDPLRKVADVYTRVQRSAAGAERIFRTLDTPLEVPDGEVGEAGAASAAPGERGVDAAAVEPLRDAIVYRDVTFTYPGASAPALHRVNLTIRRGECVAIVGPNGSGKTTLVNMLLRFYQPDTGEILYDGRRLDELPLSGLRRQIALVTQRAVVFAGTVAENIAYGRPDAGAEEVRHAARRAFADEFISTRRLGYDELVGEHGVALSGGQRQRIVIARAILRDAPILIFDEATSQIDTESDEKIHRALRELARGRTTLIIAHRPATFRFADRAVVLDAGRVLDSGGHDELLQRCALYRSLCQSP